MCSTAPTAGTCRLPDSALGAVELPDGGALVTSGTTVRPSHVDRRHRRSRAASVRRDSARHRPRRSGRVRRPREASRRPARARRDRKFGGGAVPRWRGQARGVPRRRHRGRPAPGAGPGHPAGRHVPNGCAGWRWRPPPIRRSGTVGLRSPDGRCLEVRRADALLWRSCANAGRFTSIVAISTDGHRVLLRRDKSGNPGTSEYAVAVAETGRVLRLFTAGGGTLGLGQATFENAGVLVVGLPRRRLPDRALRSRRRLPGRDRKCRREPDHLHARVVPVTPWVGSSACSPPPPYAPTRTTRSAASR